MLPQVWESQKYPKECQASDANIPHANIPRANIPHANIGYGSPNAEHENEDGASERHFQSPHSIQHNLAIPAHNLATRGLG